MHQQIETVLDKEIRPMLAMHRGNLELVSFENGVVSIRLLGTCKGCPLSDLTLKAGIEEVLVQKVPGVTRVDAIA